jgi:hypothetical protein
LPPWGEESDGQLDDIFMGSQLDGSDADSHLAEELSTGGVHSTHEGSGFLLDGREEQKDHGEWGSDPADAANRLESHASADLFEPLHRAVPQLQHPAAGGDFANTSSRSGSSGLSWHDKHSPHARDTFPEDAFDQPPRFH